MNSQRFNLIQLCLPALITVGFPILAHATLDEQESDQQTVEQSFHIKSHLVDQKPKYHKHEIQSRRTLLHEFSHPGGKVFALSWQGTAPPDLRSVSGSHYDEVMAAYINAKKTHFGHGPIVIETANFHLEMGGRSRSLHGRLWLKDKLPEGVSTDEFK